MKVKKDTDENPVGHNETGVEDPEGAERKNPIQTDTLKTNGHSGSTLMAKIRI